MKALGAGATALQGYTPYTFHGFGLLREIAEEVKTELKKRNFKNLQEYQALSNNASLF